MERRQFVRVCATGAGAANCATGIGSAMLVRSVPAADPVQPKRYPRAKLAGAGGMALKASQLAINKNYLFFYPFQGTPCFLLNLGKPLKPAPTRGFQGVSYEWPGGAGASKSIVAYSAICSHQLTYPTKDISFISFRAGKGGANKYADVIHCCS